MTSTHHFRIGTRGSMLALWQANFVATRIEKLGHSTELVEISTAGDASANQPFPAFPLPGVFTKEIQSALLENRIDFTVHSVKDLTTETLEGLTLAAVPIRANPSDALLSTTGDNLASLPQGAIVGTSSVRRAAQLLRARPELNIQPIRGNVPTRIEKMDRGEYACIVLAIAGLERLGLADRATEIFSLETMLPAIGQGALGVECRVDDAAAQIVAEQLNDAAAFRSVLAERALLRALGGGCSSPVGALCRVAGKNNETLELRAIVLLPDGTSAITDQLSGPADQPETLGMTLAERLLKSGAGDILRKR